MRGLALKPDILLLDEPVAGMNDHEAFELGEILKMVSAQGVAILLIDHNMRFVMSLCQYVYVLASGQLIAEGTADVVLSDRAVVSAYLGE
jgi:branched-chain amino acid transport system ATP-binding protein